MAIYPCAFVPHRYFEAQQTAYYTCVLDHVVKTWRGRLCNIHFEHVVTVCRGVLNDIADNPLTSDKCENCGEPRTLTAQARLFPKHQEQAQLVADLCGRCGIALEEQLHVGDWELLPAR